MDGRRFRTGQDAESENCAGTARSLSGFDLTRRPFSLGTFFYSHLRCSPFGPASPFAPSAQWASKRKYLAREGETRLTLFSARRAWHLVPKSKEISPPGELLSLLVQRK